MRHSLTTKRPAAKLRFATLKRIAEDTPEDVMEALEGIKKHYTEQIEKVEAFIENLSDEPAEEGKKEASAKKFATLRQIAQDTPEDIADALQELYDGVDVSAEYIETLADNMDVELDEGEDKGEPKEASTQETLFSTQGEPEPFEVEDKREQGVVDLPEVYEDLEKGKTPIEPKQASYFVLKATNAKTGKTAGYFNGNDFTSKYNTGGKQFANVETAKMAAKRVNVPKGHKLSLARVKKAAPGTLASLDSFTRHYLETALWSTSDDFESNGGDPLDDRFGIEDLEQEVIDKAVADCAAFREKAGVLLEPYDDGTAGHDFWLTRNHHGAGFWDGDYEVNEGDGDKLTEIAQTFPSVDLYIVVYDASGNQVPCGEEEGAEDAETLRAKIDSGEYTVKIYCH